MPRSGGIFTLVPGYFATDGTTIEVSQHNPPLEDIAQALTDSLPRDGSAPMTGNLAMGSNKITNLAAATNPADAVRFDQLPTFTPTTATLTAGTDAQGQGPITTDQVTITTAAANPSGATLPTAVAAKRVIIANRGANPVNIYPATGAAIGALATNAPVLLAVNQSVEFFARSATQWEGQISQPLDADLTALAALASTGIAVRTAADTWAQRQITSADGSVTITNPAGVAGDINLSVGGGTALASWAYSSNVTSIPLIGLAGWDSVVVTGFLTISANVQIRVSADNGSTWRSTNYVWFVSDEGGGTQPTDGMDLCRIGSGSIQFDITFQRMSQANRGTYASGNARHGNPRMNTFAGIHNVSEVINAVQIVGATISAGYVDVYGIRRA